MRCRFPKNTPRSVRKDLTEFVSTVQSIMQDMMIGLYLHGSLAMGCYNPRSSDIDIIIVAQNKLSIEQRKEVVECCKRICSRGKRIELSVISEDVIRNPQYPMVVDLHFENWGNIFINHRDKEILSNLYTAKERGFCVWGTPTIEVFSKIPVKYHIRSVIEDITRTRDHIHEKPELIGYDVAVYWILGSCRILAFIREEKVLSKLEGGHWGIANLPRKYRALIGQALSRYQATKKRAQNWRDDELEAFADYMTRTILKESRLNNR